MSNQLVSPNLSASGQIGWCEQFAERVWNSPVRKPNAITGWNDIPDKYKHSGEPPADRITQLYWEYQADGHTATNVPGRGILSSPWKIGTSQAWLPNRTELERIYSDNYAPGKRLTYLGWSDYFNGVLVAQEGEEMNPPTPAEITAAFREFYVDGPSAAQLQSYQNPAVSWRGLYRDLGLAHAADLTQQRDDALAQAAGTYTPYTGSQLFVKKG